MNDALHSVRRAMRSAAIRLACLAIVASLLVSTSYADHVKDLQKSAIEQDKAAWGHWGASPEEYTGWTSHSNRLIPIYTFSLPLDSVDGANSPYRSVPRLRSLYGQIPDGTRNFSAEYFDQTDVYTLQRAAVDAGKKYIFLIVFDGMDWQTTQAAAIYKSGKVGYTEGRGAGLAFQDYRGVETDYGYFVTSPHNDGSSTDVNAQIVTNPGGKKPGGYDWKRGGLAPWAAPTEPEYLLGRSRENSQAYTDSAASATSLCAGIKSYNAAINVDFEGRKVETIAHVLQKQGFAIGVVTSVPISHATPACAYAHNVSRDDYQDLTRDLVGLPSIAHRGDPLPGVDVLIGAGWGENSDGQSGQGENYIPGNKYIAGGDLEKIDLERGGRYRVVQRTEGVGGAAALEAAAGDARARKARLFGLFGVGGGHLPYQTADGQYDPTLGVGKDAENYSEADVAENPTLADMTRAAITVLEADEEGFWLMVEAGDVDWANHDDNIDNSIGAVLSGDDAFRAVTEWTDTHDCWDQTAVILTADHGHFFVLTDPAVLAAPPDVAGQ